MTVWEEGRNKVTRAPQCRSNVRRVLNATVPPSDYTVNTDDCCVSTFPSKAQLETTPSLYLVHLHIIVFSYGNAILFWDHFSPREMSVHWATNRVWYYSGTGGTVPHARQASGQEKQHKLPHWPSGEMSGGQTADPTRQINIIKMCEDSPEPGSVVSYQIGLDDSFHFKSPVHSLSLQLCAVKPK